MEENTIKFIESINKWIEEKNGFNTDVIDVKGLTSLADFFIITSGSSDRNVQAIADYIDEEATKMGYETLGKEGRQSGRWILLDYNNIIIHIFHEEEREFYNLERLWSDGKRM